MFQSFNHKVAICLEMNIGNTKIWGAITATLKWFMFCCYYYNWALEYVSTKTFSLLQRAYEHKIRMTKSNSLCAKPVMDSMVTIF